MSDALLAARNLGKGFGGVTALADVSVEIRAGEVHALVGENGAGKSTLIRCWSGALRPDGGAILLDGRPVAFRGPADAEAAGLRFIHQESSLVPGFDAVENCWLGRRYPRRGLRPDWAAMRRAVADAARAIAPELPLDAPASELTTGQVRLVEIVRALLSDARVVVMDEPTAALTDREAERLFAAVERLRARGTAVVYVSHRLEEVRRLADRVTVLRDGRVVATLDRAAIEPRQLVHLMSGTLHDPGAPAPAALGPARLVLANLRVGRAPEGVSLTAHRGEVLGLYGLLGAGRSATLHAIFGARPARGGRMTLDGTPYVPRNPADAVRHGVVLVPEERRRQGLALAASIRETLTLPLLARFRRWRRVPSPSRAAQPAFARRIADRLSLRHRDTDQPVAELSGGNQQKLLIGRWLAQPNRVYLFDEPTRGVDVRSKAEIHAVIRDLAGDGATVIVASSDLLEILDISDRVAALRDGAVAALLERGQATPKTILESCYGH